MVQEYPIVLFTNIAEWEKWLEQNHAISSGIWVRFAKKNSDIKSITYQEALEIALCFGWIDSLVNKYDDKTYMQKFTPRRAKSMWSKINVEKAEELMKGGKMKPSGLLEIERAKADGRWQAAYDSPNAMEPPVEFVIKLRKNKKAFAFYETLSKANKYAIAWRIKTAKKDETKARKIKQILEMLENDEKFH